MPKVFSIITTQLPTSQAVYLSNLIKQKINSRSEVVFGDRSESDVVINLGMDPSFGKEGFQIRGERENDIQITGNDERGLLYGIGKFLRTAIYDDMNGSNFSPGMWRGTSLPNKEVRGIYFATHFNNFYHQAPIEEVLHYIEDLALWGYNAVTVWFDMHHYRSIQDIKAQEMIGRLHAILTTAKKLGLQTGLLVLGNEAYDESPLELRADWTAGHDGYTHELAHYHLELCPSKTKGSELLVKWRREIFEAFADINLEYILIWPHDQGGCSCPDCAPWGGNGFIKISKPVTSLAKQFFPGAQIILSTWYFDRFIAGEWEAFAKEINKDHAWVDYILAEFPGKFPEYILKNGVPGELPLLGFPEISMFECTPWGGFGANPLPRYIQQMWDEAGNILSGGFPYSEGIFEDINKAIVAQYYWEGAGEPEEAIREYINYEFSSRYKDEISRAILILEKTNKRDRRWHGKPEWMPSSHNPIGDEQFVIAQPEMVDEAFEILQRIDLQIRPAQRNSWRWRILYLRGLIDVELLHNNFRINDRCEEAFVELIRIYHAENSIWAVKPPSKHNRNVGWK